VAAALAAILAAAHATTLSTITARLLLKYYDPNKLTGFY
jgi:hypothetical protein